MRAAVVISLGNVEIQEVPKPDLLPGSLLIRVEACAVCGSDIRIFRKGDHRATLPRIIGHEIAGVVEEIGSGMKGFAVGERVAVAPGISCGACRYCRKGMGNVCIDPQPAIGYASSGGFAQYIAPPINVIENGFVNRIPENLSFEEASMAELLACCINGQERIQVGPGDTVLIMGAGPAGCMHLELARARGAAKIMLTQRSLDRLEFAAERFQPDRIIPGEGEAVVDRVKQETDGLGADAIIVAAPSPEAQELAFAMVAPQGRISFFGGLPKDNAMITINANTIHYKECTVTGASSSLGRQNREALQLIGSGRVRAKELITHRFELEQTLEGFRAVEGKKAIKAVILPWK